jgi:hypothetical protein
MAKYELLKVSIERRLVELPAGTDAARVQEIRQELSDTTPHTPIIAPRVISKPAALTGTLIVRLVGCQDLYEETNLRNFHSQPLPASLAAGDITSRQRSFANKSAAKRASRDDLSGWCDMFNQHRD